MPTADLRDVLTGPVLDVAPRLLGAVLSHGEVAAVRRPGIRRRDWARGPARLATTLGLDGTRTGADACADDSVVVFHAPVPPVDVGSLRTGPRVGVSGAGGDAQAHPWRFWLADEPSVSVYRPAKPRARHTPP